MKIKAGISILWVSYPFFSVRGVHLLEKRGAPDGNPKSGFARNATGSIIALQQVNELNHAFTAPGA